MTTQPQKQAVLNALKRGPHTTFELIISGAGVSPTRRIFELRQDGHEIVRTEERRDGKRICTYRLVE